MGRAATATDLIMKISSCRLVVVITFLLSQVLAQELIEEDSKQDKIQSSREPKLFYVSTLTSTTTLTTSSICHIIFSTALGVQTCVKKKRSISFLDELPIKPSKLNREDVAPSPSFEDSEIEEILPGIEGD